MINLVAAALLASVTAGPEQSPGWINAYSKLVCIERAHPRRCANSATIAYRRSDDASLELIAEGLTYAQCGPDGANDWEDRAGPTCERFGWDGRRYTNKGHN